MEFRTAGIHWNPTKTSGVEVAREIIELLHKYNKDAMICRELANQLDRHDIESTDFSECDLLLVLGGDGTILSALDYALPNDLPILGINLGRLGMLTEIDPNDLEKDIRELSEGRYAMDARIMMTIEGQDANSIFALNEVVVTRSTPALRALTLEVYVNGMLADRFSGDGVIVASSTGSTGYSLSAGGPIMRPGLDCFVITPICAHKMNSRPVVVSSNDRVTIRASGARAQVVMDGRKVFELDEEGITVVGSDKQARFIRLHDRNYFSLLRDKLSEWTH